jgi:transcriptional regulator with XRE-family HTH domain
MLNVKIERMRRGWSQAELARRANLNAATVGQIEAGRFQPYPTQLAKLARALGVPEAEASILLRDDGADAERGSHSSTGDATHRVVPRG